MCECATVTVAFSLSMSIDIGFPTMLLLPITTHSLPSISTLYLFNNSIIPYGVHEINPLFPIESAPTLAG